MGKDGKSMFFTHSIHHFDPIFFKHKITFQNKIFDRMVDGTKFYIYILKLHSLAQCI